MITLAEVNRVKGAPWQASGYLPVECQLVSLREDCYNRQIHRVSSFNSAYMMRKHKDKTNAGSAKRTSNRSAASDRSNPLDQAKALHAAGRLTEAKRAYKKLLSKRPKDAELRHLAGLLAWQAGDARQAANHLGHAVTLRSSFAEAHSNLGRVLVELGRSEEAVACFLRAVELKPEYLLALNNLAFLLAKLERYEEAIPYFDRVLALEPDRAEAQNNRGLALQRLGRLEDAVIGFGRALEIKPDYAIAALNLGETLQKLGRLDEAEASLRRAVALDPASAKAVVGVGTLLVEKQNIDEAITYYRKALDLNPAYDAALNNLGLALKFRPNFDREIAACREILSAQPNTASVKIKLAGLLWQQGAADEAAILLEPVLAAEAANASANYWFGLVHQGRDDLTRARHFFERALALDPGDVHAEAALANLDGAERMHREEGTKRVALHINQRYHYRILRPVFDALRKEGHICRLTPHVSELTAFEPDMVILAESHAPYLRHRLPKALFVWVRHGLISKNATTHAARVADFACLTSEASRDWYIRQGGRPRRDFWITGYPQMDILFQPGAPPLGVELEPDRKVVLYAPTWTPGLSSADMLGERVVDLIRGRRTDITLLIKPHPVTVNHRPEWLETWRAVAASYDHVHVFDDPAADVMPLLKKADVLVTDASSVMFQYLAVNRPMVLITNPGRFQVSHYDPRGIEWRWRDVGREVHDREELAPAVSDALDDRTLGSEQRARYRRELFGRYTDGRAAERIAQKITELEL